MKRSKILTGVLFALFLGVFLFSGAMLLDALGEYRQGDHAYNDLEQFVQLSTQPQQTQPTETVPQATDETQPPQPLAAFPEVNFQALWETAPDAVGWLYMEDTKINYPTVQAGDNAYYLNRLPSGKKNSAGSIYLDYRNSPDFSDRHSILYGHFMKNGSMFGMLNKLRKQDYFDSHNTLLLVTPQRNFLVELFAVYVENMQGDGWLLSFTTDEEFESWYEGILARSEVTSAVTVTPQDRLLTLSTCNYDFRDAKLLVVGVLRESPA